MNEDVKNKPDRAKMRPDCVLARIDFGDRHARYMEGQKEGWTDRYNDLKESLI